MSQIHVIQENPAWLPPLADALDARGLPCFIRGQFSSEPVDINNSR
jgi:hypothetical protein